MSAWIDNTSLHSAGRCLLPEVGKAKSETDVRSLIHLAILIVFNDKIIVNGWEHSDIQSRSRAIIKKLTDEGLGENIIELTETNDNTKRKYFEIAEKTAHECAERLSNLNLTSNHFGLVVPSVLSDIALEVERSYFEIINKPAEELAALLKEYRLSSAPGVEIIRYMFAYSEKLRKRYSDITMEIENRSTKRNNIENYLRYCLNQNLASEMKAHYAPDINRYARMKMIGRLDKFELLPTGLPSVALYLIREANGNPHKLVQKALEKRNELASIRDGFSKLTYDKVNQTIGTPKINEDSELVEKQFSTGPDALNIMVSEYTIAKEKLDHYRKTIMLSEVSDEVSYKKIKERELEGVEKLISHKITELSDITKVYGTNVVNDGISCTIYDGEVHAFLGENGAGKSTLMKILAGYVKPDKGFIRINHKVVNFNSPAEAKASGIGMVHQQFSLIDKLTILENLIIGNNAIPNFFSKKKIEQRAIELLSDIGVDLNINEYVSNLNIADKQLVEILKLLWCENDILIMDEPLSQLSFFEGEKVLNLISKIAKIKNKTILLISHNIAEILKYADRITVLRNGKLVKTLNSKETNEDELANLMIGDNHTSVLPKENHVSDVSPLVSVKNLSTKQGDNASDIPLRDINIDVMRGEILGIAGIKDNGQESFLSVLHGNIIPEKGIIVLNGKNGNVKNINKKLFISCIPIDSISEGSIPEMSITDNLLFKQVENGNFSNGVLLKRENMVETATSIIRKYGIQPTSHLSIAKNLSGGNLQKTIIARELESNWELLLASNPLSGLDIKFSKLLFNLFIQYRNEGRSILFQSNNVTHLFEVCDRIAVFNRGKLMGILNREDYQLDRIASLMGGLLKQQS